MESLNGGRTKPLTLNNTGTPETFASVQIMQITGEKKENYPAGERNDVTHGQSLF